MTLQVTEQRLANDRKSGRTNKLNDLTGREWIKFTKSWFVHRPEPRRDRKILHPAPFPESLAREFIRFFTKEGQVVVDPFLGTGSSLVACVQTGRRGIGVEIVRKYCRIASERTKKALAETGKDGDGVQVLHGNSKNLSHIWMENRLPMVDYCITSPPYWNQLKRSSMRQKNRARRGLDTKYSDDTEEIGTVDDYKSFLAEVKKIFNEVHKVTRRNGYLTIVTNNVFSDGRMYPLAFDTVSLLSAEPYPWVPKDEKVWCQDDKALLPLGVYSAWVGNRHHQYCLIFRKEA